jgi:hypothetical protein
MHVMSDMLAWLEAHPGLASWGQAIGTVLAIIFALLLPRWERKQLEEATAMSLRLPLRDAWFAFYSAHDYALRRPYAPSREKTLRALQLAIERLGHVPLHGLSTRCADALSFIRDELSLMHEALSGKQLGGDESEQADYLRDKMHEAFRDLYRAAPQASDVEIAAQIAQAPGQKRLE